jgi:Flp pilus assembly protein TadB
MEDLAMGMPCMTGWAGLRQMKRGMDSSDEIVYHNLLRNATHIVKRMESPKKRTLHINKRFREKAAELNQSNNSRGLSGKYLLCASVAGAALILCFLYSLSCYILVFLGLLSLAVPYLVFQYFILSLKHKPQAALKQHKIRLKIKPVK